MGGALRERACRLIPHPPNTPQPTGAALVAELDTMIALADEAGGVYE